MPFGLCNAPATFQRCMTTIFSEFLGDSLEVVMDDFSIFGNNFESCLAHLTKILEVCVRKRLVLRWEKSHFMVREGVVLGYIVSEKGLEVDKAKIEVIHNLPLPNTVKDLRGFLGSYRLLSKIHPGLRESIQALHHPSLQGQGLHHRRRREVRIHDVEASTDRGTNFTKSQLGLTLRDYARRFGLRGGSGLGAVTGQEADGHLLRK